MNPFKKVAELMVIHRNRFRLYSGMMIMYVFLSLSIVKPYHDLIFSFSSILAILVIVVLFPTLFYLDDAIIEYKRSQKNEDTHV